VKAFQGDDAQAGPEVRIRNMVGEEILVEGTDVSEEEVEEVICKHLGLPPPEPQKKGVLGRLFK
jgi:hypothetical protein